MDSGYSRLDRLQAPKVGEHMILPSGVEHGTHAAVRAGCLCSECTAKVSKMRRHDNRLRTLEVDDER